MKTTGTAIREAREAREMTRKELAKRLAISPGYLGHLETDNHVPVSPRVLELLKKTLGQHFKVTKSAIEKTNNYARNWYRKYNAKRA